MSAASAVPAAVRLPRSAAARRALLTFLFLGGFLALAVVLGGSAQAASGPGHDLQTGGASSGLVKSEKSPGSGAGSPDKARRSGEQGEKGENGEAGDNTAGHALTKAELASQQRRAVRDAAQQTASHVVGPVAEDADDTGELTRPVGEAVHGACDPSELGELPARLGLGEAVDGEGAGDTGDQAGGTGTDGTSDATADDAGDRADGPRTHGSRAMASYVTSPGAAGATSGENISRDGGDPVDRLPFHRTPAVPVPGASQYAGDGQGQRGSAHQHDAVVSGTEHLGPLQPGAVRAVDGVPTRDRAGDALEFPG